jgi:hypothetical protein
VSPLLVWLEESRLATIVGQSTLLTGSLSAVHLVGMTIVSGGALVSSLTLLGVLGTGREPGTALPSIIRGMDVGLTLSLVSGILLVSPRATSAAGNVIFQVKMSLLLVAAVLHVGLHRHAAARRVASTWAARFLPLVVVTLWLGVAAGGIAYILFE